MTKQSNVTVITVSDIPPIPAQGHMAYHKGFFARFGVGVISDSLRERADHHPILVANAGLFRRRIGLLPCLLPFDSVIPRAISRLSLI